MRLSHEPLKISASFDDPNLVSRAGLVPVMSLAGRSGLLGLARRHVRIAAKTGVCPDAKVACLVAGMAAGADSIDDMDLLRHGAMGEVFGGVRAPSTLGSFLRSFTWGNVRQLEQVSRELLAGLARVAPLLPGGQALWLTLAAITGNLVRAAGCLAPAFHARARGATIRRDLIGVAARTARHGRGSLTLHLPGYWHRESEWRSLFEAACGPPRARAA